MNEAQEKTFQEGEGDAWYRRNRAHLDAGHEDPANRLIAGLAARAAIRRVAELGCANGWRLERLRRLLPPGCVLAGIDASAEAIADGRQRFPELRLERGLLSDVPLREPFDLVVVHFVLHWADRGTLSKCVAEIDRLVAWNGYLVLGDFLPDAPSKRPYHHLPGQGVYTYKQDYAQAFLGLGFYRELERVTFDHGGGAGGADSRAVVSLLRKSADAYGEG